jgi:DNA-binding protein YbaB
VTSAAFPDLRQLTEQLSRLSADMQRTRQELDAVDVYGASTDGLVRATMRSGKLVALTIEAAAMETGPVHLANQVIAAVQECEAHTVQMLVNRTAHLKDAVAETIDALQ